MKDFVPFVTCTSVFTETSMIGFIELPTYNKCCEEFVTCNNRSAHSAKVKQAKKINDFNILCSYYTLHDRTYLHLFLLYTKEL